MLALIKLSIMFTSYTSFTRTRTDTCDTTSTL